MRILSIFSESQSVFNLKEVEKLGAKKGVVQQTIKDINQLLVDDGKVDTDKIGSGKWRQQRERKRETLVPAQPFWECGARRPVACSPTSRWS